MKCPLCTVDLVLAERQGVEIDHCPQCRGVWLDRGELDKIVDRMQVGAPSRRGDFDAYRERDDDDDDAARYSQRHHAPPHRPQKKSWLGELFDFD